MANQPHAETVTVSFTLPKSLDNALETESRLMMTNKSDIIRKACMAWLAPSVRADVLKEITTKYKTMPH